MCPSQDESNIQDDPDVKGDSEVREEVVETQVESAAEGDPENKDEPETQEESEDAASQDGPEVSGGEMAPGPKMSEGDPPNVVFERLASNQSNGPVEEAPVEPGTPLEHQDGEIFHLQVKQITSEDSVVTARWCICPDKIQELRESGAKNLHILIVIKPKGGGVEQRRVIPVEEEMAYLSFLSPGMHTVQATLVWSTGEAKKMRKRLLKKHTRNEYAAYVLDDEGKLRDDEAFWNHYQVNAHKVGHAEIDIDVPEEFFAKEPPKWLSKWVNFGHKYDPVDQCSFRRRFI